MFVILLAYSSNTDWLWQYVTEVQVVDTPSTANPTSTHVVPPSSHERVPEDEEWTPIISSGDLSSPPSITPTPNTTTSRNLSEEIAYVIISILYDKFFLLRA